MRYRVEFITETTRYEKGNRIQVINISDKLVGAPRNTGYENVRADISNRTEIQKATF